MKKAALIFLVLLGIFSCQKDENGPIGKGDMVFGDYKKMQITQIDTVVKGAYHNPQYFDIDINNDKTYDIRLLSEIWGSSALGQHPRSIVYCLHEDVELYGYLQDDTTFLSRSTRVIPGIEPAVEIYEYYYYTCNRMTEDDEVLGIIKDCLKVTPAEKNTILRRQDFFQCDSVTLIDDHYGFPYFPEYIGQDTVLYNVRFFFNDCNIFPLDEIRYIGLKMKKGSSEKLGWIKVMISDKYKITLLEAAIQK